VAPTATATPARTPAAPAPVAAPRRVAVDPRVAGALVVAVLVGATFRFWGLGAQRFGFDDAFTTMAARMPVDRLFGYLRLHDSHPPLDYLLREPFSRLFTSEWWLRLPSVLCSTAALALFAWWMRTRGRLGVIATALFAVSAFEIAHGRQVRMYPELELLGVGAAMIAESWLARPRRWHARAIGALVLACLLLHVSGFLLGAGLVALAGRRTDAEAWRWRRALVFALLGWGVIWGSSFVTQTGGGHSDWIPRTTPRHLLNTVGRLVTTGPHPVLVLVCVGVAGGAFLLVRADRRLGRVWLGCVAIPIALAALTGTVAPVLLDRTLTVTAWGAILAIAYVVDRAFRPSHLLGAVAVVAVALLMFPPAVDAVTRPSTPDAALSRLDAVVQPGDVVAIRPRVKAPEMTWAIGVRAHRATDSVTVPGLANTAAVAVDTTGDRPTKATGRIWLLDWNRRPIGTGFTECAPTWRHGTARVFCLRALAPAG
jgi:hypothetical protein